MDTSANALPQSNLAKLYIVIDNKVAKAEPIIP
jgi:hypothetical protein